MDDRIQAAAVSAPDGAELRTAYCAWCNGELQTRQPWRLNEYQVHTDCLPALDEHRSTIQSFMWKALRGVLQREERVQEVGTDPWCVRDRRLVCADDLCHGVEQTLCGMWSGHDFADPNDNDYDEDYGGSGEVETT